MLEGHPPIVDPVNLLAEALTLFHDQTLGDPHRMGIPADPERILPDMGEAICGG